MADGLTDRYMERPAVHGRTGPVRLCQPISPPVLPAGGWTGSAGTRTLDVDGGDALSRDIVSRSEDRAWGEYGDAL